MSGYPRKTYIPGNVRLNMNTGVPGSQAVHYNASHPPRKSLTSVLVGASKDVIASKEVKTAKDYLTGGKAKAHLSVAAKTASGYLDTASQKIGGTHPVMVDGQPVDPQIVRFFKTVDADKSGKLNSSELQKALLSGINSQFSLDSCEKLITFFDRSHSGSVNINEFQQLFQMVSNWKAIFDAHDTDRSGNIDESELQKAFKQLGHNLTPIFTHKILRLYNPRTKRITLDHFIFICLEIKRLSDQFRARDVGMNGQVNMQYEEFVGIAMDLSV